MRKTIGLWFGMLALACVSGHAAPIDETPSTLGNPAWQGLKGRLSLGTVGPFRSEVGNLESDTQKVSSLSLMGDYYFARPALLGTTGGLRATSGLLLGPHAALWSSPASVDRRHSAGSLDTSNEGTGTLPYLGLGYSSLSDKSGWGLSADLGLLGSPGSTVRLGKVLGGTQSLDDTLRDLRFSPLLQLGVSYSF